MVSISSETLPLVPQIMFLFHRQLTGRQPQTPCDRKHKYTVVVRLQRDDDERYRSPPARLAGKSSRAAPPADTAKRSTKKPHKHAQALVTSGLAVSRATVAKVATSALTSVAPAKYR